jgi:hypothetical protein
VFFVWFIASALVGFVRSPVSVCSPLFFSFIEIPHYETRRWWILW